MTNPTAPIGPDERLMKLAEVERMVAVSRQSIYAWMAAGTFPRTLQLGPGSVGWKKFEIDAWILGLPGMGRAADAADDI